MRAVSKYFEVNYRDLHIGEVLTRICTKFYTKIGGYLFQLIIY